MGGLSVEYPAMTDAEKILAALDNCQSLLMSIQGRLDGQAQGINSIGENLQWLVSNTQGLFQMFASPQFVSQMSNMLMGGVGNAGQSPGADTGAAEAGTNG